jgi:hypothetical protein
MKKTLFTRAIASIAAVPLAFTQCLTVANAVSVSDVDLADASVAAAKNEITLNGENGLLYIAPDKGGASSDEYFEVSKDEKTATFEKESIWNETVYAKLITSGNKTGDLDFSTYYDRIIARSGNYKDTTKAILQNVETPHYTVNADGDIIIKVHVNNITDTFAKEGKQTITKTLKDLAAQYGVEDYEPTVTLFDDILIGGDFTVTIKGSDLQEGTSISGDVQFRPLDNPKNIIYGTGVFDYALTQLNALKNEAKAEMAKYPQIDTTDAEKKINDSLSYYEKQINRAKKTEENAQNYTTNGVKSYDSADDVLVAFEKSKYGQKLEKRFNKQIPTCAEKAAASQTFQKYFNQALAKANALAAPYVVNITADELGTFAEDISDITVEAANGKTTITGKFTDAEKAEVETYFNDVVLKEDGYEDFKFEDSYKEFTVEVDYSSVSNDKGGKGSVDVQIKRVVKAVKEEVETTTSTSTSTTDTTTSTSTTDTTTSTSTTDTTTSTSTTDTTTSTSTTDTTTSTSTTDTTTSTSTTDTTTSTSTTDTTTSTSTTDTTTSTSTTDTTTSTSTTDTTTSTSTTDTTTSTTTTTTGTVTTINYRYEVVANTGYYCSIQKSFNKKQIQSVKLISEVVQLYIDNDGNVIKNSDGEPLSVVINPETAKDVTDLVDFGTATPANVFEYGKAEFKHDLPLYAADNITDAFGNVITVKGGRVTSADRTYPVATVYVGVKGDANLDFAVDSKDATVVLSWYTEKATGGGDIFANSQFVASYNEEGVLVANEGADMNLDQLAAFLADVTNEIDANNFMLDKNARTLNSIDASFILALYTEQSTSTEKGVAPRELWNKAMEGSSYVIND